MPRMKDRFKSVKSSILTVVSGVAFIFFIWLLLFSKIKASELLSPLLNKLPKNESELVKTTENILGTAVQRLRDGGAKKAIEKGSEVFEESEVAEPAREIRENVKQSVDETFSAAKELPAKEIKTIQRQICKEWFGEEFLATPSGR